MKKILSLLLTTLLVSSFFIACKNSNNSIKNAEDKELTADEKEVIKKAISNQIDIVIQGAKELNVDKAASVYSDDAAHKNVKEPKFTNRTPTATSIWTVWSIIYTYFTTLIHFDPP